MKNAFSYSISLRVTHPRWSADQIVAAFELAPKYRWTVGDSRIAPSGKPLGGFRKESYCCFNIEQGEDGEIAKALSNAVDVLMPRKGDLVALRASGGTISFYVFWHANGDTGEVMNLALLANMVELGIELDLNVLELSDAVSS
jgi:hypothetical protein